MKIQCPNGEKISVDKSLDIDKKIERVNQILELWMDYIDTNFDKDECRFFLNGLANYLIWHKYEDSPSEDKEVLSRNKTDVLNRGSREIVFSNLSVENRNLIEGENGGGN